MCANPRAEADENDLFVENRRLLNLGLEPITLSEGLLRRGDRDRAGATPTAPTGPRSPAGACGGRLPTGAEWSSSPPLAKGSSSG